MKMYTWTIIECLHASMEPDSECLQIANLVTCIYISNPDGVKALEATPPTMPLKKFMSTWEPAMR